MLPTVLDCLRFDSVPSCCAQCHCLLEINGVYIILACFIKIDGAKTAQAAVVSLPISDDASVKRLNMGSEVGFEELEGDVGGFVTDITVAREVIEQEENMPPLDAHLLVELSDAPMKQILLVKMGSKQKYDCFTYCSKISRFIQAFLLL